MFLKVNSLLISQGFISNVIFPVIETAVDNIIKNINFKKGNFQSLSLFSACIILLLGPMHKRDKQIQSVVSLFNEWSVQNYVGDMQFGMELMQDSRAVFSGPKRHPFLKRDLILSFSFLFFNMRTFKISKPVSNPYM